MSVLFGRLTRYGDDRWTVVVPGIGESVKMPERHARAISAFIKNPARYDGPGMDSLRAHFGISGHGLDVATVLAARFSKLESELEAYKKRLT